MYMYMCVAVYYVYIKYYRFTVTGCRIYQFIGTAGRSDGPVFSELFAHYYDNIKGTSIMHVNRMIILIMLAGCLSPVQLSF